eukprot:g4644.t1
MAYATCLVEMNMLESFRLRPRVSGLNPKPSCVTSVEAKWITRLTLCECEIKDMDKQQHGACLRVKETGELSIQLAMIGERHERCLEYASEYKITQVLTNQVSDWCLSIHYFTFTVLINFNMKNIHDNSL